MLISLVIYTLAPALILFDGAQVGESCQDGPLALQIDRNSRHFICAIPLDEGFLPRAFCVEVSEGLLKTPPGITWPDCVEVMLPLEPCFRFSPASVLDTLTAGNAKASVFREYGVHFALERDGQVMFSKTLADKGSGELARFGQCILAFSSESAVAVDLDTGRPLFTLKGDCRLSEGKLLCTQALNKIPGHKRVLTVDPETGKTLHSEVVSPGLPQTPPEAALALMESVRLGLSEALPQLLGGELSQVGLSDLQEFFGPFDYSAAHPFRWELCGALRNDSTTARVFRFDTEDTGDCIRVVNASQL